MRKPRMSTKIRYAADAQFLPMLEVAADFHSTTANIAPITRLT